VELIGGVSRILTRVQQQAG